VHHHDIDEVLHDIIVGIHNARYIHHGIASHSTNNNSSIANGPRIATTMNTSDVKTLTGSMICNLLSRHGMHVGE
jgi:hypothetical protein